jgi:hypothetical protein
MGGIIIGWPITFEVVFFFGFRFVWVGLVVAVRLLAGAFTRAVVPGVWLASWVFCCGRGGLGGWF